MAQPGKAKNMRATCLQAQCTDNQHFFKHSEAVGIFVGCCLVLTIFLRNFKKAGWVSYKAKTYIAYIYVFYLGDAAT